MRTELKVLYYLARVAVIIGTGGDAPHTGEELKGTWGTNSSGGTKKLTRLTSNRGFTEI